MYNEGKIFSALTQLCLQLNGSELLDGKGEFPNEEVNVGVGDRFVNGDPQNVLEETHRLDNHSNSLTNLFLFQFRHL